MIVSWLVGPASLIFFLPWFKSDLSFNIISSILFVAYYSLLFSKILKYYYYDQKIKIIFAIFIVMAINTVSNIILIRSFSTISF
jgi:hypothetical protein